MKKVVPFLVVSFISIVGMAQINYTDIPDVVLTAANSDSKTIDLDGDNVIDLIVFSSVKDTTIQGFSTTITGVAITTMGSTGIIASNVQIGNETVIIADTLKTGHMIDVNSTYLNSATPSVYPGVGLGIHSSFGDFSAGDFIAQPPLYFGVKFDISGNTHYGWVRVSIAGGAVSGTLYEYGYEQTADTGIEAGKMSSNNFVDIEKAGKIDAEVYAHGKQIIVRGDNLLGDLEIINLIGKTVYQNAITGPKTINLNDLSEGIYLITYSEGNQRLTKKVLIQ